MKRFFNIEAEKYIFDYNDIRMILTVFNVIMIITFGLTVAYIGLAIAIFGTIRDLVIEERKSKFDKDKNEEYDIVLRYY